jgi:hypothetical protein
MRYVWVNERVKPMTAFCAYDHIALVDGYVRELSTGFLCQACCLEHQKLECDEIVRQAKIS